LLNTKVSKNNGGDRKLKDFGQNNNNQIKNIFSKKLEFTNKVSEDLDYKNKKSKENSIKSAFSHFGIDLKEIDKYDEYGNKKGKNDNNNDM
jgi:hypothetical protein